MDNGEFEEGTKSLRLNIDMASPNLHMRDPIIYRIKKEGHYNLPLSNYNVYPMYDFAHCISDSIEKISHSLCTLEFEVHRPLYEWILNKLDLHCPKQIEFARLNVDYTVMSKRFLRTLVEDGIVDGWDDPRMLTIAGMRRRGYTKKALFNFIDKVGVTKRDTITDMKLLESCIREDLNKTSERRMAVLKPLKLTVTNYSEVEVEWLDAVNNPEDENAGTRKIGFSKQLWIEKDDFKIEANSKYKRMSPERYIRLKYAYIVKCTGYNLDDNGEVCEVFCEYIPESKSGSGYNEIKAKGDFRESINDNSLETLTNCKLEISLGNSKPEERFQFERLGYFCLDSDSDSNPFSKKVFNRTIDLRSNWK
jgi:glutaminyl-tRNA synthetase